MRIVVADDHLIVRRGFRAIVAARPEWTVAEAATIAELFEALRAERCDVLALDLTIGDRSSLDVLGQLTAEFPTLRILMLASERETQFAVRVLRAGAHGFITKDGSAEEFLDAIARVGGGGRYVGASVSEFIADELVRGSNDQPHERLSTREFEVFRQIARGLSLTEIAEQLNLSVKTVSTYRSRLLIKMNFRSNADLVAYAVRNQLV